MISSSLSSAAALTVWRVHWTVIPPATKALPLEVTTSSERFGTSGSISHALQSQLPAPSNLSPILRMIFGRCRAFRPVRNSWPHHLPFLAVS